MQPNYLRNKELEDTWVRHTSRVFTGGMWKKLCKHNVDPSYVPFFICVIFFFYNIVETLSMLL